MQKLDIKTSLKKCGAVKLSNMLGVERLETIVSMMGGAVTESKMTDILISKYGTQILAERIIRDALLQSLEQKYLNFLLYGDELKQVELQGDARDKIKHTQWRRNNEITQNWLSLFQLDESYLPILKENIPSFEVIDADTQLYPYQKRVKDRLVNILFSDTKRVLLHMPTGSGKTRTTIEGLIDYWRSQGDSNGFMVWLTDSEELCIQAEETFKKLWKVRGDRPMNLLRLWGTHKIKELPDNGGLIIASLQKTFSQSKSKSDEEFRFISNMQGKIRLIVVDEAHKSIAPTYQAAIQFLCVLDKTKVIGLTATPGRNNMQQIENLVDFYDGEKITLTEKNGNDMKDSISFLQENQYLSNITREKIPTDFTIELTEAEKASISNSFEIPQRVIRALSKDEQRNMIIINKIVSLCRKNQIIVFACSVEHAHLLSDLLMIQNIRAACIDSSTTSYDRRNYIEKYKAGDIKILINYGVLTTGFDAPNTNAVMITRPTNSLVLYSQMIGRGIRGIKMGGTADCRLIDLEDNLVGYPSEQQAFNFFNDYWSN